jgi:hypothetical protein
MLRTVLLAAMLVLVSACSDTARLVWARALMQTSDNLLYAPRTYCTTTVAGHSAYSSCYTY